MPLLQQLVSEVQETARNELTKGSLPLRVHNCETRRSAPGFTLYHSVCKRISFALHVIGRSNTTLGQMMAMVHLQTFFPIFSGQAKIVMNASQHSSQFPSMVNQNSIPIQNQLNRYKQKLSTLLIIPSNLKYDMQKSKMNYYVFDLGQIILRPKVRWSVTYYRSRCVCADETVTLLQRSVIAICL